MSYSIIVIAYINLANSSFLLQTKTNMMREGASKGIQNPISSCATVLYHQVLGGIGVSQQEFDITSCLIFSGSDARWMLIGSFTLLGFPPSSSKYTTKKRANSFRSCAWSHLVRMTYFQRLRSSHQRERGWFGNDVMPCILTFPWSNISAVIADILA